jgi:hypothetical protein
MAVYRFLSALFLLVAAVALVADMTPVLIGGVPFAATSMSAHWADLAPSSLAAAKTAVNVAAPPWVWETLIAGVIDRPTFVIFGLLALVTGYHGRRRHEVNIYVN